MSRGSSTAAASTVFAFSNFLKVLCLVACTLFSVAGAQVTPTTAAPLSVIVDGVGAVLVNPAAARDEAIRDALRRAVEQAVGVTVEGRTLMVDLQIVEDRVTGRAEGFVRSYEVVEEIRVDDLYRVTIEALVDTELLTDDLEGYGAILRLSLGNPRLLVIAASEDGLREEPEVQRVLVDHLVERQFLVVSPDQLGALYSRDAIGNPSELATMARTVDADLVVVASVTTEYVSTTATDRNRIVSERASVSLQAVLARTGQIIASRTSASTNASTSLGRARSDAIGSALALALPRFTLDTISVLNDSISGSGGAQSFRVLITDVNDFDTVLLIREALSVMRGVESIQQRQFDGTSVIFDLQGSATTEEVAIQMTSLSGFSVAVDYLDSQRLDLRLEDD